MGEIALHSDSQTSVTSVSNIFIDEYMADANGEFVKIYLYLLRLMNEPMPAFSISSIADKFEHTEKDVKRALSYWERMQLLRLEYDEKQNLIGVCLLDSSSQSKEMTSAEGLSPEKAAPVSADAPLTAPAAKPDIPAAPPKKQYSPDDITEFRKQESVAELFFITERYLGRTLNSTDINTVLYLFDGLHFSADLIEYLIEYCVSKGRTSIHYIEKTALNWADSNIHTVDEAKQNNAAHSRTYFSIQKAFGISGRNLVPSEAAFIDKWKNTYGFTNELILAACKRTMTAIHQPSFEYADSILTNWKKHQVHTLEDVTRLDTAFSNKKKTIPAVSAAPKNRFNNFPQRSYDYEQLEKILLTTDAHSK